MIKRLVLSVAIVILLCSITLAINAGTISLIYWATGFELLESSLINVGLWVFGSMVYWTYLLLSLRERS